MNILGENKNDWKEIVEKEICKPNGEMTSNLKNINKCSCLNIGNKNIYRTIDSKKRTILYSVKQGDNLYRIADLFGVEASDIKKLNDLGDSAIMPGQIIKIIIKAF